MLWFKMPKNLEDFEISNKYAPIVFEIMYFANSKTGRCSFNATSLRTKYCINTRQMACILRAMIVHKLLKRGGAKGEYFCVFTWDDVSTAYQQRINSVSTACKERATLTIEENRVDKNRTNMFDFDVVYDHYPRKDGKSVGMRKCKANIKTQKQYDQILQASKNYAKHCEYEKTEKKFIKQFSSFMSCWEDWVDGTNFLPDYSFITGEDTTTVDINEIFKKPV